jgi:hypothetical protein
MFSGLLLIADMGADIVDVRVVPTADKERDAPIADGREKRALGSLAHSD